MKTEVYFYNNKMYNLPLKEVQGFLDLYGVGVQKAIQVQGPKGKVYNLPPDKVEGFLADPLNAGSVRIDESSSPPVPGFTTPNPVSHPWEALNNPSDDNLNANFYQNLNIDQQNVDESVVLNTERPIAPVIEPPSKKGIWQVEAEKYGTVPEHIQMLWDLYNEGDSLMDFDQYLNESKETGEFDELNFATTTPVDTEITPGEAHKKALLAHLSEIPKDVGTIGPTKDDKKAKLGATKLDPLNVMLLRRLGYDYEQIEKHGKKLLKEWATEQGFATQPTGEEMAMFMMQAGLILPATAGAIGVGVRIVKGPKAAAPYIKQAVSAAKGVAVFMGLNEIENVVASATSGRKFVPLSNDRISSLLPDNWWGRRLEDPLDMILLVAKGFGVHKINAKLPELAQKFTKELVTKYKLPPKVYLDPKEVRQILVDPKSDVYAKVTPEQQKMFDDLDLDAKGMAKASREGVSIEVPVEKIVLLRDRPYWAKLKKIIKLKPMEKVISRQTVEKPVVVEEIPKERQLKEGEVKVDEIETPIVESEVPIIDGKGNPVIARFDEKRGVIETNPEEFDKLPDVEKMETLKHEDGHAFYDSLTKEEQDLIKAKYDAMPVDVRLKFEEEFPTEKGLEHTEYFAQKYAKMGTQSEGFKKVIGNVPESMQSLHEFNKKNELTNDLTIEIVDKPLEFAYTKEELEDFGYGYLANKESLIKEGEIGYVEGKELYGVEEHGTNIAHFDGSNGKTILNSGAGPDAYIEDAIVEPIYKKLKKENPGLLQRIKKWEQSLKLALNDLGIDAPEGMELFSSAYTFNRLGYTATDEIAAELFFLPEDIMADFDALVGDISHIIGPEKPRLKKIAPTPVEKEVSTIRPPPKEYKIGTEVYLSNAESKWNRSGKAFIDVYDAGTNRYSFKDPSGNPVTESGRKDGKPIWLAPDHFAEHVKGVASQKGAARYHDSIKTIPESKRAEAKIKQKEFKNILLANDEIILGPEWEAVMMRENIITGSSSSEEILLPILYEQMRLNLGLPEVVDFSLPADRFRYMHQLKEWLKNPQVIENPSLDLGPPSFQLKKRKNEPIWHSKAVTAINKLGYRYPQKSLKARGVKKYFQKEGVSAEEMKWLGMDEFLAKYKPNESIPAEDLVNFIKAQQVELKEVHKKAATKKFLYSTAEGYSAAIERARLARDFDLQEKLTSEWEAFEGVGPSDIMGDVKYGKYTLPGGEDYGELLITLADVKELSPTDKLARVIDRTPGLTGPSAQRPDVKFDYITPHWDEANVLAHVRHNTRWDREGNKILFLEEGQSDWHHKGVKEGYDIPESAVQQANKIKIIKRLDKEFGLSLEEAKLIDDSYSGAVKFGWQDRNLIQGLVDAYRSLHRGNLKTGGVPDAPYKDFDWVTLLQKRMLRYAVENNFDKISWITGKQTVDRYPDAITEVDRIVYTPPKEYGLKEHIAPRYEIKAYTGTDELNVWPRFMTEKEIVQNLPKDIAKQIIEDKGEPMFLESKHDPRASSIENHYRRSGRDIPQAKPPQRLDSKTLDNISIKQGGEYNMKLYDEEFPLRAQKLVKKFGGKLSETDLMTPYVSVKGLTNIEVLEMPEYNGWGLMGLDRYGDSMIVERPNGERMLFGNRSLAQGYLDEAYSSRQGANPSIEITTEMKEAFGRSQPSFQLKPRKSLRDKKARRKAKELIAQQHDFDATEIAKDVAELVVERRSYLNVAAIKTNEFVHNLIDNTTKEERELISFLVEKTDIPDALDRPDLKQMYNNIDLRKKLQPIIKDVRTYLDNMWEKIVREKPEMSEYQVRNYLTHMWVLPLAGKKKADVVSWFTTNNKYLKQRYIETIKEGIEEFELTPKVLDVANIIAGYSSVTHKAIANRRFVDAIRRLKTDEGIELVVSNNVGKDRGWPEIRNAALRDHYGAYDRVHPDIYESLKVIFDSPNPTDVGRAYKILGANLKFSQLSISFFHSIALTEAGLGMMPARYVAKALWPYIWNAMIKGEKDAWKHFPGALQAAERGLQIGITQDIPMNEVQSTLNALAERFKWMPGAKSFINTFAKFTDRWNIALWDYLHDGLKIMAYQYHVGRLSPTDPRPWASKLIKPKYVIPEDQMILAEREIAQIVNDTFGGQFFDILGTRQRKTNFNKMLYNPKTMAILNNLMLATDWNISTLRQFGAPFGYGAMYPETAKLRAEIGRRFWGRVIVIFGLGYNALNVVNRIIDEKKNPKLYFDEEGNQTHLKWWEYTMLGNTLGKRSNIFLGRDKRGRELYIRGGKQFREAWELFENRYGWGFPGPLKDKAGSKANPNLQLLSMLFTGSSLSGFPNYDLKEAKGNWDVAYGMLVTVLKAPLPFSAKAMADAKRDWSPVNLFVPTSAGMSGGFAQDLFEMELMRKNPNMGSILEIYIGCYRNNLDAKSLLNSAINRVEARAVEDLRERWNNAIDLQREYEQATDPYVKNAIARDLKYMLKKDALMEHQMKFWPGLTQKIQQMRKNLK